MRYLNLNYYLWGNTMNNHDKEAQAEAILARLAAGEQINALEYLRVYKKLQETGQTHLVSHEVDEHEWR